MWKAGNLSTSLPDAPHDCKDIFCLYQPESKTKSVAIILSFLAALLATDWLNAVITQTMSQCADSEQNQSIAASPKILKETDNLD